MSVQRWKIGNRGYVAQVAVWLVWSVATTAVVYLYYTYLHFQPSRGALVVRAHGLAALFMSAMFALPMLVLGRLVLRVRNEMVAAGRPSFVELVAALLIGLLTPTIVIGLVPLIPAWVFYIHFLTGWHSSSEIASIALRLLVLTLGAFIVIRASFVAYDAHLKRLGWLLAYALVYMWMWYTGSLLFIGQVFI